MSVDRAAGSGKAEEPSLAELLAILELTRRVLSPRQYSLLEGAIRRHAASERERTRLAALLKVYEDTVKEQNLKIDALQRQLHNPKSEKLTDAKRQQLGLPKKAPTSAQPPPASSPAPESSPPPAREFKKERKGGGRGPPPEILPVDIEVIDVPEDQRQGMEIIRFEVTNQIDILPRRHRLRRIVRPVWGSRERIRPPLVAPLPLQVIPKAGVTVGFIVHILVSRFVDHIPYYRQVQIDERSGVSIGRNARCRYAGHAASLLLTIYGQLKELVRCGVYLHIDEAFTKLLDATRPGKARDAYVWGFFAPHEQAMVMEFSTSRSADVVRGFLGDEWSGVAHTDGALMYPAAFKERPGIIHIECMNHFRRYVLAAVEAGQKEALPLLQDIIELYAIEAEAAERNLTLAQRGLLRHAKAKPVLKRLQRKLLQLSKREKQGGEPLLSKLGTAVNYGVSRWAHLALYAKVDKGFVNIDQNPIERLWRGQKVGLRNYLFIGSPKAGWYSAVIYTIVSTCRLVGVEPEEYLMWVLPKLAAATTKSAQGLLPHDFKKLKEAHAEAARQKPPPRSRPSCNTRSPAGQWRYRRRHRRRDVIPLAA
jgi:transposase